MFIGDAFLGNFDRHNGNWGFLIDESNAIVEISPIYDCGSCLYPQATEEVMKEVLTDEVQRNARIFVFPNSALKLTKRKSIILILLVLMSIKNVPRHYLE